ncbi:MAG TPA: hypothetical protein VKZ43_01015, partial [Trueperaceae bacterium]|nr:hypothetical protein [Trueperaceae bacterium]
MTTSDDQAQAAVSRLEFLREAVTALPAYRFEHHPQRVKLDQNEAPDALAPELLAAAMELVRSVD